MGAKSTDRGPTGDVRMGAHYPIEQRTMRDMDPQLVENARRTLESERARLRLELSEEVEHPRVSHGAQTAASTEVSESQRGQQLREREELHLAQIEGALRLIDKGAFGLCQTCGKSIAPERLEALPWATDCIDCHPKRRR
jgi:RNA polymerase-binding protein DksA